MQSVFLTLLGTPSVTSFDWFGTGIESVVEEGSTNVTWTSEVD